MALDPTIRDMIGDQLADAVDAARDRLIDDSVMARCSEGLWLVEVGGLAIAEGLSIEAAVAAVAALEPS